MQFLYLAPVGLVQAGLDGEIVMINPISAQLLMPLSPDGCLTNLFTALESVAPELRLQCQQYPRSNGMVFEGLHIHLRADEQARTQHAADPVADPAETRRRAHHGRDRRRHGRDAARTPAAPERRLAQRHPDPHQRLRAGRARPRRPPVRLERQHRARDRLRRARHRLALLDFLSAGCDDGRAPARPPARSRQQRLEHGRRPAPARRRQPVLVQRPDRAAAGPRSLRRRPACPGLLPDPARHQRQARRHRKAAPGGLLRPPDLAGQPARLLRGRRDRNSTAPRTPRASWR